MHLKNIVIILLTMLSSQCFGMSFVEKYEDIEVGDWVVLRIEKKNAEEFYLIAGKDEKTVTIECKERAVIKKKGRTEKYLVSWRQLVIDLEEKRTVLIRDKDLLSGAITEHKPQPEEDIDDVLQADFVLEKEESIKHTIEKWDDEQKKYVEERNTYNCEVYKGKVLENRFVRIWYAKDIPLLYPLKANLPGLQTTILLVRHGTGRKSTFGPPEQNNKPEE